MKFKAKYERVIDYPLCKFGIRATQFGESMRLDPHKNGEINELLNSLYPTQINDYVMMRYPSDFAPGVAGKLVPADFELASIILYLWSNCIVTTGWNHGIGEDQLTSIEIEPILNGTNLNAMDLLIKMGDTFGIELKIINYTTIEIVKNSIKDNPNVMVIASSDVRLGRTYGLFMSKHLLLRIYLETGLQMIDSSMARKGGVFEGEIIEKYDIC